MDRIGTGNAKLLLFGEHSAVYGFPSLGLGLPASARIEISVEGHRGWSFPDLRGEDGIRFGEFLEYAASILPKIAKGGGTIRVSSTIPRGLGFGSSAAICVGLAKAFAPEDATATDIWLLAHRAEGFFHGTPSGIDTGLSLLGDLRSFRPSPPALPATGTLRGFPLHFVIGAVTRRASTSAQVTALGERLASGDDRAGRLVEELGGIAEKAITCMEEGDGDRPEAMDRLGALLAAAHSALGELGLGDPRIDRLLRRGIELGAGGGKQSGSGGGGAFFLIYPSRDAAGVGAKALAEFARLEGIALAAPLRAFTPAFRL